MTKRKPQSHAARQKRAPQSKNLPLMSPFAGESMMRNIQRLLDEKNFRTIDEANAFLASLTGSGFKGMDAAESLSPQEEAQELAYAAMEASTRGEALELAAQALAKDPDCVDALVILAATGSDSIEKLIAGLQRAVAAGERSLGTECFERGKGHFWGMLETRPYMRARQQLADALKVSGRRSDAIAHYRALLDLNPNDNQGIRDTLLGCYLAEGDLDGAGTLLRKYERDASAVFAWGRILERFLAADLDGAGKALRRARSSNGFVELYLTGNRKLPKSRPDSYTFGSDEEACLCIDNLGEAWAAHPPALFWLHTQRESARPGFRTPRKTSRRF